MNTAHGEQEYGPVGTGLGLSLDFASFVTTRNAVGVMFKNRTDEPIDAAFSFCTRARSQLPNSDR